MRASHGALPIHGSRESSIDSIAVLLARRMQRPIGVAQDFAKSFSKFAIAQRREKFRRNLRCSGQICDHPLRLLEKVVTPKSIPKAGQVVKCRPVRWDPWGKRSAPDCGLAKARRQGAQARGVMGDAGRGLGRRVPARTGSGAGRASACGRRNFGEICGAEKIFAAKKFACDREEILSYA